MKKSEVEGALDIKIGFEVPLRPGRPARRQPGSAPGGCRLARLREGDPGVAKFLLANEQPKKRRKFAALAKA